MFGTNNQHVPKSEFCTLVNKHCGRQHGHNYDHELVFGQLFVKQFTLCYQTIVVSVCLSCL